MSWLRGFSVCVALLWAATGFAESTELSVQGRLSNASGGPVSDGTYPMQIAIYADAVGGDALWTELFIAVPVQSGVFSATLGAAKTKLDSMLFLNGKPLFLGLTVAADAELARQPLRRVPFAVQASVANLALDLQCSGCISSDDLAKGAVTVEKIADGAVSAAKVAFNWAASAAPGGPATLAVAAKSAETAAFAEEAGTATSATNAKGLQCSGCVSAAMLADGVSADLVKAGKLAAVAVSGKYSDLQGGPDLTGYGALANGNAWVKSQNLLGGAALGANLDFANNQAVMFRFQNAAKEPAACDATKLGLAYVSTVDGNLYICNGKKFKAFVMSAVGSQTNPADSCKAIFDAGDGIIDGKYWLKQGSGAAFQGWCNMTLEGGGWTRYINLVDSPSFQSIANIANDQEFVSNNTFLFSTNMLKNSAHEVLIVETVAPFRMHRYDFKKGDNMSSDNFVGAITGDFSGKVGVWNWVKNQWDTQASGKCNSNNHTQWNCEPSYGVRFHVGTRDWTKDGGSSPPDGNWYFTGYAQASGAYTSAQLPELVKNWNGVYNATAHDFYFR